MTVHSIQNSAVTWQNVTRIFYICFTFYITFKQNASWLCLRYNFRKKINGENGNDKRLLFE